MIELGTGPASGLVGLVAVAVVAWGAWLSLGSSRRGPAWAHDALTTWKWMPWAVAALGLVLIALVKPIWAGIAVIYIAAVTGWLTRTLRRGLDRVREAYGELGPPPAGGPTVSPRVSTYLLVGAAVLALLAAWDTTVRGWVGLFGLALALCLGGVGIVLRRSH